MVGDEVDQNCDGTEVCYRDGDNDGARSGSTVVSVNLSCADANEALATDPDDCCDTDANAKPGQTAYFAAPRSGCGGWDYNCDTVISLGFPNQSGFPICQGSTPPCIPVAPGWQNLPIPSCNTTRSDYRDCAASCAAGTFTVTQTCR